MRVEVYRKFMNIKSIHRYRLQRKADGLSQNFEEH